MIPEAGEETLQAVLNGDAEAFRSILRSYGPRVERLVSAHVLPHEVPEVAQETFVRAYRSLRSYQGQGSFERWLATIALRCCYERLRERYRPEAPFSSLARGEEDEPEGLTDQASFRLYEEENERRDLREELESALQSLEPRDRMLLTLTFLEGYSIAETAAMMDERVSSSGACSDTDSVICSFSRANISILSAIPLVDKEIWRCPMLIPSGQLTRCRNLSTLS